jgi:hypothetical protein
VMAPARENFEELRQLLPQAEFRNRLDHLR